MSAHQMARPRRAALAALLLAAAQSGCVNLAPPDERPAAPVRSAWPAAVAAAASAASGATSAVAIEDIAWRDFFTDERLRRVIERALDNNRDLRVAAALIERARGTYGVQRSELFPTIGAVASRSRSRSSGTLDSGGSGDGSGSSNARVTTQYRAELGFSSYEIDLFGRVRNLSEAALQRFFTVTENRRSTQISLVAEAASAWLTLAADRDRLQLAQETLASRQRSYELIRRTKELGGASGLTLAQAQTTVDAARVAAAVYESQVAQDRNALELLVGDALPDDLLPPAASDPAAPDAAATRLVEVPAGLPATLLQRRPDVRAAEFTLRAANADIGAARAAFYPSISLTATAGLASGSLSNLFQRASGVWSFVPQVTVPIFNAGANRSGLAVAEAQRAADLAAYEKSLQVAFREVADALAERSSLGERQAAQRSLVAANQRVLGLAEALFKNGASSYLEVLDAQRSLYTVQQEAIGLRLAEQVNRVTLYKVLGGGYGPPDVASAAAGRESGSPQTR